MGSPPSGSPAATPLGLGRVLGVALPIMASNATTPLIGFVDAAVIGQLGRADLIGGVAVAAAIFNALLWLFGFLRMGTTGFTAQAAGANDQNEVAAALLRAFIVAAAGGLLIVFSQKPILQAFLWFLGGSPAVQAATADYYTWRIWGVPAGLLNFALLGWFIGLGRASVAFWLQLLMNLTNIAAALALTIGLDCGVAGVGIAALISEVSAAAVGIAVAARELRSRGVRRIAGAMNYDRFRRTMGANLDILLRTACVLGATQIVTRQGAQAGDIALAANALLLNIVFISFYILDGFAFAAETFVGHAIGARNREELENAVRLTMTAAALTGLGLALGIWLTGDAVVSAMTPNVQIRAAALIFLPWAALSPLIGVWCFQLDGVFIGATRTSDMRNMMLVSFVAFLAACALLTPPFGNHGLWAALQVFYIVRALTLSARLPALVAAVPKSDRVSGAEAPAAVPETGRRP